MIKLVLPVSKTAEMPFKTLESPNDFSMSFIVIICLTIIGLEYN